MKLPQQQLNEHLRQTLAPIYLITGDEPLLIQETCAAVRERAKQTGYTECRTMAVAQGFDWHEIWSASHRLSLFHEKRLLELRLTTNRPGSSGSKALLDYCREIAHDLCLLLVMPKLDAKAQAGKWYKAIEKKGIVIQVWPVGQQQMPQWITQRLQRLKITAERSAVQLLAEYVEGNLLAASQAVEKLYLLYGANHLRVDDVRNSISNTARFNVFQLLDSALMGEPKRVVTIMQGLQQEGLEPAIVLWAIARELRLLVSFSLQIQQGQTFESLYRAHRIYYQRQKILRSILTKYQHPFFCRLLTCAQGIDEIIKGVRVARVWDELLTLYLALAGVNLKG